MSIQSLPKGYYAVISNKEELPKDRICFRGITYAVETGVNAFATVHEASAHAAEIPDEVLEAVALWAFKCVLTGILWGLRLHIATR